MRHPGTVRSAYSRSTTEATNGYLDDNLRPTEKRGGEFRFFIQAARQYGSPVLELASGAGRMLMVLAEAGFDVYGLETSRPMMQLAQRAIGHRREHSRIRLIRGDMFRFAFSRKFPLIIVPYSTFWFTYDLATPKRCRHLGHETAHEACETQARTSHAPICKPRSRLHRRCTSSGWRSRSGIRTARGRMNGGSGMPADDTVSRLSLVTRIGSHPTA